MAFALNIFSKVLHKIFVLIGDNCATNRAVASKIKLPIIVFSRHEFLLAAKKVITESMGVLGMYSG